MQIKTSIILLGGAIMVTQIGNRKATQDIDVVIATTDRRHLSVSPASDCSGCLDQRRLSFHKLKQQRLQLVTTQVREQTLKGRTFFIHFRSTFSRVTTRVLCSPFLFSNSPKVGQGHKENRREDDAVRMPVRAESVQEALHSSSSGFLKTVGDRPH
jgi:hypothetical protein